MTLTGELAELAPVPATCGRLHHGREALTQAGEGIERLLLNEPVVRGSHASLLAAMRQSTANTTSAILRETSALVSSRSLVWKR